MILEACLEHSTERPSIAALKNLFQDLRGTFGRIGVTDDECAALAAGFNQRYAEVIAEYDIDVAALLRIWRDERDARERHRR
jgi:hypothetical protein